MRSRTLLRALAPRQVLRLLFGLTLTALFVYLIIEELDWSLVWQVIHKANLMWLVVCVIPWIISLFIRVTRWWWILRIHVPDLTLQACVWPYLIGALLNLAIPLRAGDVARAFGFCKQLKSPATRVLGTLVVERVFDLLVVVIFFFVGLIGVTATDVLPPMMQLIAAFVAGIGVAGLLALIMGQRLLRQWVHTIAGHDRVSKYAFSRTVVEWLDHFFDGVSSMRTPAMFWKFLAFTIVVWSLEGLMFIFVAISLNLQNFTLAPWLSFTMATLATTIPSAPGFVGTFDYFGALGMVAYGLDWNRAAAFIVLVHLILVTPFSVVVLVWIFRSQRPPRISKPSKPGLTKQSGPKASSERPHTP